MPYTLEFPYKRSVGPVIGGFLAGLREKKLHGARTAGGRVLVPPLEYDPDTGEATGELVEVGSSGVVTGCAFTPEARDVHPIDGPFAWVLVRLDGADTSLFHVLDVPSVDAAKPGMRVRVRWRDEREGHIRDIECFEPEDGA